MKEVFLPDLSASFRWLSLCFTFGIAGLIVAALALRRRSFPIRQVSQMLGGLVALVCLGGAGAILWDILRTPSVCVTEEYVILGNDTIPSARIERSYLEDVSEYNLMGEPAVRQVAILELEGGRVQLFGAEEFDVEGLIRALRRAEQSVGR